MANGFMEIIFYGWIDYNHLKGEDKKHYILGYDNKNQYYIFEVDPKTVGQFTGTVRQER